MSLSYVTDTLYAVMVSLATLIAYAVLVLRAYREHYRHRDARSLTQWAAVVSLFAYGWLEVVHTMLRLPGDQGPALQLIALLRGIVLALSLYLLALTRRTP